MKINERASGNQFSAVKSPFCRDGCYEHLGVIVASSVMYPWLNGSVSGSSCGKLLLYLPYTCCLLYVTREQKPNLAPILLL